MYEVSKARRGVEKGGERERDAEKERRKERRRTHRKKGCSDGEGTQRRKLNGEERERESVDERNG